MKSLLLQVIRLAKLVLVVIATNSASEQSFSAMRQAKSYLQSTMGQQRLNNILVLHVRKNRTNKLDLITVGNCLLTVLKHALHILDASMLLTDGVRTSQ